MDIVILLFCGGDGSSCFLVCLSYQWTADSLIGQLPVIEDLCPALVFGIWPCTHAARSLELQFNHGGVCCCGLLEACFTVTVHAPEFFASGECCHLGHGCSLCNHSKITTCNSCSFGKCWNGDCESKNERSIGADPMLKTNVDENTRCNTTTLW